ncbi:hypothetical protein [Aurantibacillus circumpalustris]|uniref:hypothetical protein n=1 Tax=Aurantibacillus circumpalustris TaxID=3036359 RepID=UPI00295A90E9|nr:hypothetical protein [Aurantibacillus circumpalustris]
MKKNHYFLPFFLIVLTCFISFRFLFFVSYVHIKKVEFRQQLLENKSAEVIKFSFEKNDLFQNKNGFQWEKNNKELVVNGVYHEVVKIIKTATGAIVYAIEDKAENSLFQTYFSLNEDIQKDGTTLLKQILNLNYLAPNTLAQNNVEYKKITYIEAKILFSPLVYVLKTIKPPEILSLYF